MLIILSILVRRIFFMGAPGSAKQENAMALAEYFQWKFISTGDLLRREVNNKTEKGNRIQECFNNFKFGKFENFLEAFQLIKSF